MLLSIASRHSGPHLCYSSYDRALHGTHGQTTVTFLVSRESTCERGAVRHCTPEYISLLDKSF